MLKVLALYLDHYHRFRLSYRFCPIPKGKYGEAKARFEDAIWKWKEFFSPEHKTLAGVLNGMVGVLRELVSVSTF